MGTPSNVLLGAGKWWAAPLGTAEPTGNVAAQASGIAGWRDLGYTEDGGAFRYEYRAEAIMVEEEFDPVRWVTVSRQAAFLAQWAEYTRQNLAMALNMGANAANDTTPLEPPAPNTEVRLMLMFEADSGARWLGRQCLQVEAINSPRRKAPNKATIPTRFNMEKPTGLAPFKVWPAANGLL